MSAAWHDEARRLRAEDPRRWTIRALAEHFGKGRGTVGDLFKPYPTPPCLWCGLPLAGGNRGKARRVYCAACRRAVNDVRRTLVEGMWADDWSIRSIGAVTGVRGRWVGAYREQGWDLPYRYRNTKRQLAA